MFIKQNKNSNEALSGSVYVVIWDFRKLAFPSHLETYFIKIWKISAKIPEIGKYRPCLDWERLPQYKAVKNGPIQSLVQD